MTSKRRLRRRQCTRKQYHADQQSANRHAYKLRRLGRIGTRAYKCTWCNGWHVGRLSKKQKQAIKAHKEAKLS